MASDKSGLTIESPKPAPNPKPPVIAQRAPFVGWLGRHILLPLTPFIVGSLIRTLKSGRLSISSLDPTELSFSLAMFCLIGVVAARKIEIIQYREAAFAVFVVGVAIFMSLFSLSVAQAWQFENTRDQALKEAEAALEQKQQGELPNHNQILQIMRKSDQESCQHTLEMTLAAAGGLGFLFVVVGFTLRDRYGLGED
jgi:hypothetical protein